MHEIFLDDATFSGIDSYRGFVTDRFTRMVEIYDDELFCYIES